jgi:hypothetical protein
MTMEGKKWWAWQGLNLRPLRCQHTAFCANPQKTAISSSGRTGTGGEHGPSRGDLTARLPGWRRVHDMALRPRNILSLCAGVGGLELGIALALHARGEAARGICYVEREASAAASLVASMEAGWLHPAPVWSDLTTFDARPWRGLVHILASGDPCQDNSVAGQRAGAEGERFLAPEVVPSRRRVPA